MKTKPDKHAMKQLIQGPSKCSLSGKEDAMADSILKSKSDQKISRCRLCVVLLGCSALHFVIFGIHYSFGAMFAKMLTKFKSGQGQTAWVGSLASASMFFWAVASVKLCDVTSVSFTCFSGSVLGAVGLILTSLANQLEVLYVTHSLMFGLGTSLMYTPSLIVIARYYGKWRSAATGLVVSCGSLGQLVLSPLLNFFVVSYGISLTFRWLGSAFAVVSILSSLSFYLLDKKTKLERTGAAVEADWRIMAELLKNKSFLLWILVMMICNFTYYIPLIHLSKYAEEIGADTQASSLLLTAIAASAMLGRVCFGKVSNYRPGVTMAVYQFSMFASGILTLFASFSTTFWHLVLYSIAYGFLDGSFIGLISIVTMQIVGLVHMAQGWSVMLFSISFPIALGPATVGWINDNDSVDGRALFYMSGIPMVVGAALMILIRKWHVRGLDAMSEKDETQDQFQPMLQLITVL